jgi:hypothetical protein
MGASPGTHHRWIERSSIVNLETNPSADENRARSGVEALQLLNGLLMVISKTPSPLLVIASANMAAMLANPTFEPHTDKGETRAEACARRACDYALALLSEVERLEDSAKGGQP